MFIIRSNQKIRNEWEVFFSQGSYEDLERDFQEAYGLAHKQGKDLAYSLVTSLLENRECGYKVGKQEVSAKVAARRAKSTREPKEWSVLLKRRNDGEYTPLNEGDWESAFFAPFTVTCSFKDGRTEKMGEGKTFPRGCASDKTTASMRVEMLNAYESQMLRAKFCADLSPSFEVATFLRWYKRGVRLRRALMQDRLPGIPGKIPTDGYDPAQEHHCDDDGWVIPWFMLPPSERMLQFGYGDHYAKCGKDALKCEACREEIVGVLH